MKKKKKAYSVLEHAALPTKQQTDKMLAYIMFAYREYDAAPAGKFWRLMTVYPWRFAFGLSTVQAVLCTLIWGTGYTNMVLKIFGG